MGFSNILDLIFLASMSAIFKVLQSEINGPMSEACVIRDKRNRGHGSISRVAFNAEDGETQESDELLPDPELAHRSTLKSDEDSVGLNAESKRPLIEIIMPNQKKVKPANVSTTPTKVPPVSFSGSNSRENVSSQITNVFTVPKKEKKDDKADASLKLEDYEKLANILQGYANRPSSFVSSLDDDKSKADCADYTTDFPLIPTRKSFGEYSTPKPIFEVSLPFIARTSEAVTQVSIWNGTIEKIETSSASVDFRQFQRMSQKILKANPQIFGRVVIQREGLLKANVSHAKYEPKKEVSMDKNEHNATVWVEKANSNDISDDRRLNGSWTGGRPADGSAKGSILKLANKSFMEKTEEQRSQKPSPESRPSGVSISKLIQTEKIAEKAYVYFIREGFARQSESNEYAFVASITLIRDGEKTILVDTGLGTDINGRTDLIDKLAKLDVPPPSVDFVVTTHGHPDHAGNTNDFPDSMHFQGSMVLHRLKFNLTNLFENESHQLTNNVYLLKTPGHTSEDISVVVFNADQFGTLVVAGDTFIAAEDLDFPMMWKPLAWNESVQDEYRRRLLCLANYIVPGHGKVFKVTRTMLSRINCVD